VLRKDKILLVACGAAALAALLGSGCSPMPSFEDLTVEETYEVGMDAAARGDDLVATEAFRRITTDYPLHEYADDALLGLADTYREAGDYASAEEAYWRLLSDYPQSPLVPEVQYKLGVTYYEQSPPSDLDQAMTHDAIDRLELFVSTYPDDEHVPDAQAKIAELRSKLAEKDYRNAMLYVTLKAPDSARIYLSAVADDYGDTVWARRALLELARSFCSEGSGARGRETYSRIIEQYPGTEEAATAGAEMEGCGS
jgi:outer membrane protein assembly factor BamD